MENESFNEIHDHDDMTDEEQTEDEMEGSKFNKFNIIYSFDNGMLSENEKDMEDYDTDYEVDSSDDNIDEDEYNEIMEKNINEATDEDWEKVLIMEEKKIRKRKKEHKKYK